MARIVDDSEQPRPQHTDGSVATWAWVTAVLLSILALPLLFFPRFLVFLATPSSPPDTRPEHLTQLEKFLAVQFGLFLVAIAVALVLCIPSPSPLERQQQALGHPLLGTITIAASLVSLISYNTRAVGSLSTIVFLFTAVIGTWGLWVSLFEGTSSLSRKTGADKHTSAFLFTNTAAASAQKKRWKEEHN